MTSRRNRKATPKPKPLRQTAEILTSEEESTDGGSVTRCVCGEIHNVGLMVQCDKCEVWQHCDCVGLTEERIPDHYYCERCHPENHIYIKVHGRIKRVYHPNGSTDTFPQVTTPLSSQSPEMTKKEISDTNGNRAPKRRKRAANGTDQPANGKKPPKANRKVAVASTNVRSQASPQSRRSSVSSSVGSVDKMNAEEDGWTEVSVARSEDREGNTDELSDHDRVVGEEENNQQTERMTRSRRGARGNEMASPLEEMQDLEIQIPSPRRKKPNTNGGKRAGSTPAASSSPSVARSNSGKQTKVGMRASTPQISDEPTVSVVTTHTPYWDEHGLPTRESSPPTKVKLPTTKMSLADMNRRAKQIQDYVGKMQQDMLLSGKHGLKNHECTMKLGSYDNVTHINVDVAELKEAEYMGRSRSLSISSSSSSLSSASTLPLMDEDHDEFISTKCNSVLSASSPTTPVPLTSSLRCSEEETSLDIMNRLTREVVKFQRKFGILYQQTSRTTRSSLKERASPQRHTSVKLAKR
ncbi:uncharacterized protein BYT42DRAFT_195696 [Radiomyces spectabilis]|uniref:uncharacterized protein n=1 Tax=Radiomyces spectabilis TaxID=64574 RepID=UPI0022208F46|nr:uncharacterized protein BYT42DRAFT_195696 [Radiomyces spectabilis]KAI8391475.1 hypothetical protein BYT42DRAFT_195696 [Radiomyces spectabilis]